MSPWCLAAAVPQVHTHRTRPSTHTHTPAGLLAAANGSGKHSREPSRPRLDRLAKAHAAATLWDDLSLTLLKDTEDWDERGREKEALWTGHQVPTHT